VRDFLVHLEKERDVSPHTLTAYARDLDAFLEYLALQGLAGEEAIAGVDRLSMRGFLGYLTRKGLGKRSMGRMLSALRTFYRFLQREDSSTRTRRVSAPKFERFSGPISTAHRWTTLMPRRTGDGGPVYRRSNLAIVELFDQPSRLNPGDQPPGHDLHACQGAEGRRALPVGQPGDLALRNYEAKCDDAVRKVGLGDRHVLPQQHGEAPQRLSIQQLWPVPGPVHEDAGSTICWAHLATSADWGRPAGGRSLATRRCPRRSHAYERGTTQGCVRTAPAGGREICEGTFRAPVPNSILVTVLHTPGSRVLPTFHATTILCVCATATSR
jgi:hypothetical protein